MKTTTIQKIISNHNFGLNTHIGRYVYDIQFDYMAGCWRIIRCLSKYLKGSNKAIQYDFCGNAIKSTVDTYWEWRERIPKEAVEWIKGK